MNTQLESVRRFRTANPPRTRWSVRAGHVIAVGAGKGGVGTSTVAALLASAAAREGSALLVDGVPAVGGLSTMLNAPAGPGITGLRGDAAEPRDVLTALSDRLTLARSGVAPDTDEPAPSGAEWRVLVRRLSRLWGEFDHVVIDAGSRLDTVVAALESGAGRLVVVTDPGRIAVTAAYALMKAAWSHAPELAVDLVVNRAGSAEARGVTQVLATALDRFLDQSAELAGAVPNDPTLATSVEAGTLLEQTPDRCRAVRAAREILARLAAPVSAPIDGPAQLRLMEA